MKKRKLPKEHHDLIRLSRNAQRNVDNNIRLEWQKNWENSRARFIVENDTTTENA